MTLPNRIFFTGVPGSRWSGIAQTIETMPGFNTSDRTAARTYGHHSYSGHVGAYFGRGMELDPSLNDEYIDSAWESARGTRLVKSHDWAYCLPDIRRNFAHDWIMLVYRPDLESFAWWHEAGGFQIRYPDYRWYENSTKMLAEISAQNKAILKFAFEQHATWDYFTTKWVKREFGHVVDIEKTWPDILVTVIK